MPAHKMTPEEVAGLIRLGKVLLATILPPVVAYSVHRFTSPKFHAWFTRVWLKLLGIVGRFLLGAGVFVLAPGIAAGFGVYWLYRLGDYSLWFMQSGFHPPSEDV